MWAQFSIILNTAKIDLVLRYGYIRITAVRLVIYFFSGSSVRPTAPCPVAVYASAFARSS